MAEPLLKVEHLTKEFPVDSSVFSREKRKVSAVSDVSFRIYPGQTLGLVGESGCGKSTTGRCIMRLIEPTSGKITFDGKDVTKMNGKALKAMRRDMQYIFQDPYASLNPRMTIGEIVSEPLVIHNLMPDKVERTKYVASLLDMVGLNPEHINRYPHEFSGGQRQRVGIARAFALKPKLIICDEPVSALDVSIQAQILNLMQDLQKERGLTFIFITHDLSVVKHISDNISVMYLGNMVEKSPKKELFDNPLHPYTKALLSAIPQASIHRKKERILLEGEITSPINPKPGCRFAARCIYAQDRCREAAPPLEEMAPGHFCACYRAKELAQG